MDVPGTEFENQKHSRFENNIFENEQILQPNRPSSILQPRYVSDHSNSSYFEGLDIAAAVLASTMMLGPLLAYAVGMGV